MNFDVFLKIWWLAGWLAGLAGVWLAGLLMAGCWLLAGRMMRRRGSKDVPHARRSGEVGGLLLMSVGRMDKWMSSMSVGRMD